MDPTDLKRLSSRTSFGQLNEARKPIAGVQWPICKRKSRGSSSSITVPSSSQLPLKTSKFSIFEDGSNVAAPGVSGSGVLGESVAVNQVATNASTSDAASFMDTFNADDSLDLTFDRKRFHSYRAPLSDISFRSDVSILSDSGVSAMDELEGEFDAEGNLNTENVQKKNNGQQPPKKLTLASTIKNLGRLCQSKLPSPILLTEERKKNVGGADEEEEIDENLKASPDFLPPSVAKKFAPNLASDYCHIGGIRGILSERKQAVYDYPEYATDILSYWLKYEKRVKPRRWYMEKQPDISYKMRTILVDWLVEVGEEYNMHSETLFLAVGCLDRFLSKMSVARSKLQLVGTAALFTCSKFEEVQPPDVNDFVTITDNTYTKEQVIQMERIMLNTLSFDLMVPTAFDFIRTFTAFLYLDSQTTCLAMYLAELTLLDGERYLPYPPSIIATAAIALARYTFQNRYWDSKIENLTTHKLMDVQRCSQYLFNSFYDAPIMAQTAIFEKYKSVRYCSISMCILPAKLPWSL